MIWMLVLSLFVATALLGTGMLLSAWLVGRALNQTHNLNGLNLDVEETLQPLPLHPRVEPLPQGAIPQSEAPWTNAVVVPRATL